MGRGLEAILSVSAEAAAAPEKELRELPLELISPARRQPREHFDDEALQALADSVRERGVLQPVLVRPKPGGTYELVAGERRWRAARLAGLEAIPALVRAWADADALELALIENMAREDLSPVEEARACAALVEELGLSREEVGRRVGRSRVAVSNLIRLLELPDEVLDLLQRGTLSEGHGRALLLAGDHAARRMLARGAVALLNPHGPGADPGILVSRGQLISKSGKLIVALEDYGVHDRAVRARRYERATSPRRSST